jgi:hypothetical protein
VKSLPGLTEVHDLHIRAMSTTETGTPDRTMGSSQPTASVSTVTSNAVVSTLSKLAVPVARQAWRGKPIIWSRARTPASPPA